jgi:cytochrome oxidase Cu insertion factor (SCO1/SenC/PrrC family)
MRRRTVLVLTWLLALALPLSGRALAQEKAPEKKEAPPPLTLKIGDEAPDFTLTDDSGAKVTLSSFRGKKNVALAFYVFAFTGG